MASQYKLIRVYCDQALCDLLIAEISEMGYDSFVMTTNGFSASITGNHFDEKKLESIFHHYRKLGNIHYETEDQKEQNWNEIWEKNCDPVIIGHRCLIRATFHEPDPRFPMEIVINPKMSFGTGHHETTRMMMLNQFETDHKEKRVLDVGCGTGILSILAEKLGAGEITGIDIDPWSFQNALENVRLNHCNRTKILKGDISEFPDQSGFDLLLANINRQIILENMHHYNLLIRNGGILICSGFLAEDKDMIIREAGRNQFGFTTEKAINKWSSLVFQKKTH